MSSTPQTSIHDPERIRALAHPLRISLLDLLRDHGELTATQCAEFVGESVASCSFHLRTLEKYGFIERAQQQGKQKPWRLTTPEGFSTDVDPEVPDSLAANTELAATTFAHRGEEFRRALARLGGESPTWIEAFRLMHSALWLTADEVEELAAGFTALLQAKSGRTDAANRPDGARRVRILTAIHAEPDEQNPS